MRPAAKWLISRPHFRDKQSSLKGWDATILLMKANEEKFSDAADADDPILLRLTFQNICSFCSVIILFLSLRYFLMPFENYFWQKSGKKERQKLWLSFDPGLATWTMGQVLLVPLVSSHLLAKRREKELNITGICRVELEVDLATWAIRSTYLWAYMSCEHTVWEFSTWMKKKSRS